MRLNKPTREPMPSSRRGMLRCLAKLPIILVYTSAVLIGQQPQSLKPEEPSFTLHTEDARATLAAVRNPTLTHEEAMSVARRYGNQGVVRKLQEFKIASTTENFADALYASAHNERVTTLPEVALGFDGIKLKSLKLQTLLDQIETNPKAFQVEIQNRIRLFAPAHANIHLQGYVVAAGDGAGYAFGTMDFFLNIGIADDFQVAKRTAIHELYHSIQGAYAAARARKFNRSQSAPPSACANEQLLFANLYEEGTARFVEDTSLLSQSQSEAAEHILADFNDSVRRGHASAALLDMSVDSMEAHDPLPYDDIYEVGFLGHGLIYGIGYIMARDIAEDGGRQAIVELLSEPSYTFVSRYTHSAKYGTDNQHPLLGRSTVAAAESLAAGCK